MKPLSRTDQVLLLIIESLGERATADGIADKLWTEWHRRATRKAVYANLKSLEDRGYIAPVEPNEDLLAKPKRGAPAKYFMLEERGQAVLEALPELAFDLSDAAILSDEITIGSRSARRSLAKKDGKRTQASSSGRSGNRSR